MILSASGSFNNTVEILLSKVGRVRKVILFSSVRIKRFMVLCLPRVCALWAVDIVLDNKL